MTGDEKRRRATRDAQATKDPEAERAAEAAALRAGDASGHPLAPYVGQWVYLETWKMNYRGVLVGLPRIDGSTWLALHPCYRVGDWSLERPTSEARQETSDECPSLIPLEAAVSELSLQRPTWPRA